MITPEKAQQDYRDAMAELRKGAMTPGMSLAERNLVRDAIRELTVEYLGELEAEIRTLTSQYARFITSMTGIVEGLTGGATPASVLNRMSAIVTTGSQLIGAVAPIPGARALGRRRAPAARRKAPARAAGAAAQPLRILCVHGVGHQEKDPAFESMWRDAITAGLSQWTLNRAFEIQFVAYDALFAAHPLSAFDVAQAMIKLGSSGIVHGIADLFRRRRGFGDVTESVRWTAGMVVQWAENEKLRADARQCVLDHTAEFKPDVVLAHSLGTLLSYDAFRRPEGRRLIANRTFVSFGSQIGNPFVRSTLGGRIEPLDGAARWFHLYNSEDAAFTSPLRIATGNFEQVTTFFDIEGMLDHEATEYLRHPNTTNVVWRFLAVPAPAAARGLSKSVATLTKLSAEARPANVTKPQRRALLVGINDYPNEADRLQGCVNDVFLMSELLQENGFNADDIRVVLNERATSTNIRERLEWLLEGAEDKQDRVFYYSGHGAQIPGYGVGEKVDRKDECLVTYDFDWSRERCITDDQFYDLYSQLPYDTRFLAIFDCCHSGGLTRDGALRVRGLSPPDDIRHREIRWDVDQKMWVSRTLQRARERKAYGRPDIFGEGGDVNRLGRAVELRADRQRFDKACKELDHKGPFMPFIIQACKEKQYSYEYRHGVQSYGAFTYALSVILRDPKTPKGISWSRLVKTVADKLEDLQYDQIPCLICPTPFKNDPVPWKAK